MFHHRGCQRESAFASELMMDKEFFIVSSMDISRRWIFFCIWKIHFLYGLIYSWGNSGLFVIIFCVLVIFKEVVNTLKLDI